MDEEKVSGSVPYSGKDPFSELLDTMTSKVAALEERRAEEVWNADAREILSAMIHKGSPNEAHYYPTGAAKVADALAAERKKRFG